MQRFNHGHHAVDVCSNGQTMSSWFQLTRTDAADAVNRVAACGREDPTVLNMADEAGCTAIVNAAANRKTAMVAALLKLGANGDASPQKPASELIPAPEQSNLTG